MALLEIENLSVEFPSAAGTVRAVDSAAPRPLSFSSKLSWLNAAAGPASASTVARMAAAVASTRYGSPDRQ